MSRFRPVRLVSCLALGALGALGACATAQSTASSPRVARPGPWTEPEARVIVRFRDAAADPSDAAFRARLAADARVASIAFVRPMSGDAFVLRIGCDDPTAQITTTPHGEGGDADRCAAAVARLRALAVVRDVDVDAIARPQ